MSCAFLYEFTYVYAGFDPGEVLLDVQAQKSRHALSSLAVRTRNWLLKMYNNDED
jgi:hypothetical protein